MSTLFFVRKILQGHPQAQKLIMKEPRTMAVSELTALFKKLQVGSLQFHIVLCDQTLGANDVKKPL